MKRFFSLSCLLILLLNQQSIAQSILAEEQVDLRVNSDLLFVGETLKYAVSAFVPQGGQQKAFSGYVYVQLIGENGVVFRHKLKLSSLNGDHEFFLSTELPSGTYYLVAHTLWMRNFGHYSMKRLSILNPFEAYNSESSAQPSAYKIEAEAMIGDLVYDKRTNLVITTTGELGEGISRNLMIQSEPADFQIPVKTNADGFATIDFIPYKGYTYQVVDLSKEDQRTEMRVNRTGHGIYVKEEAGQFDFTFDLRQSESTYELQLFNDEKVAKRWSIESTEDITINKSLMKGGLNRFLLMNEGEKAIPDFFMSIESLKETAPVEEFTTRAEASLTAEVPAGTFSVVIRDAVNIWPEIRKKSPQYLGLKRAKDYQKSKEVATFEQIEYLPELEVEMQKGGIVAKANQSVENRKVTLSFLSDSTIVSATSTDKDGAFVMLYQGPDREMSTAYWSVLGQNNDFEITLTDNFMTVPEGLNFQLNEIDSIYFDEIERRSFNLQIENAFFRVSETAPTLTPDVYPAFGPDGFNKTYNFDDYTRFNTLREHFVEYIQTASMPKNADDLFRLQTPYLELDFGTNPVLVLLDGIVLNTAAIADFDPYKIKAVDLLNSRYYLNGIPFDGVLSFRTMSGQLGGFSNFERTKVMDLETAFGSRYSLEEVGLQQQKGQLPDMRSELLWIPSLKQSTDSTVPIDFTTSDVTGEFEIIIEGTKLDGSPWSSRKRFRVNEKER
jgi:hypothetical protein